MKNEIYQNVISRLAQVGIPSPRLEARLLIEHVSKKNNVFSIELNEKEKQKLEEEIQKRIHYMPLDKILQKREFYKSVFYVSEDVLSPRSDTEILVEETIRIIQNNGCQDVLELGVGSGCVLLSVLEEVKDIQGVGIDYSIKALSVAKKNMCAMNLDNRCSLRHQNWFDKSFLEDLSQTFDVVVSNPPYIPTKDIEYLDDEVKNYDPLLALDGGADGMNSYRQIANLLPYLLKKNGYGLFEIGKGQTATVCQIFEEKGFILKQIVPDLSGIERVLIFKKP